MQKLLKSRPEMDTWLASRNKPVFGGLRCWPERRKLRKSRGKAVRLGDISWSWISRIPDHFRVHPEFFAGNQTSSSSDKSSKVPPGHGLVTRLKTAWTGCLVVTSLTEKRCCWTSSSLECHDGTRIEARSCAWSYLPNMKYLQQMGPQFMNRSNILHLWI